MGRFDVMVGNNPQDIRRASTQREGWLAKALVEYKMDWGAPGIFGWYGSGDDGNVKNGSERMPSVCPYTFMTSFMGDGNLAWGPSNDYLDLNVSMAGTWGIGLQLRDMKFLDNLTHTFRVAWWGGTNSPSMVKYMNNSYAWESASNHFDGPYLTTNDGLLEFNLVNVYKMYENFNINLELGYIANFMDGDTWKRTIPAGAPTANRMPGRPSLFSLTPSDFSGTSAFLPCDSSARKTPRQRGTVLEIVCGVFWRLSKTDAFFNAASPHAS